MSPFLAFESELERSLKCIPMAVRLKLDQCGIKLSLSDWNQFPEGNRRNLLQARCDEPRQVTRYREALCRLIQVTLGGDPQLIAVPEIPPWDDAVIPTQVTDKFTQMGVNLPTPTQWRALNTLQRFALVKLTRSAHENHNLIPALREFGLLT